MTTPSRDRPLVLPNPSSGKGSWESLISHFEDVAAENSWNDDQKLLWLRVRLTDRACTAYTSLPAATKANYEDSKKPLTERFEPSSERELYLAEWHTRGQSKAEGWAEFKEDLKQLTYKAYPELPDEAKEQMALNQYMRHLQNPQLAFSVKQIRPKLWMKQ